MVGLMLLQGLRSKEVLSLNRDDSLLAESQISSAYVVKAANFAFCHWLRRLSSYWITIYSLTDTAVFVSLKERVRGTRMTPEGLRSLFRHHRVTTGVVHANPHRFRHAFASDMIRAGVSLPALMQLMGH
jgi:site-specific recombinase XerD